MNVKQIIKKREHIKIGGSKNKIDLTHIKMCAEKLGLTRQYKGKKYHLYGAGTWDWATHTAKYLRAHENAEAISVPFADPELYYKAIYVRV